MFGGPFPSDLSGFLLIKTNASCHDLLTFHSACIGAFS